MKKLYRSRSDKMLFGVCGGVSQYLGVDSTLIRLIVGLSFIAGAPILIYILAAIVIPKEPYWDTHTPYGRRPHDEFEGNGFHNYSGMNDNRRNAYDTQLDEEMDQLEKDAMRDEIRRLRDELSKRDSKM
ncbi:PspC domain-containing protein [Brevibacillus daliensis]|uniref:PspC domain-containing protein n=1 Tax=Brevibacillus daliensis TaxID=2892995 RepID=UPI001E43B80F|nr:PspC domain-containing protein [Brevibacillus daliensis]